jgi:hypothetical protein
MPAGFVVLAIAITTLLLPWLRKWLRDLIRWLAEGVVFAIASHIVDRALRIRRGSSAKLLKRSKVVIEIVEEETNEYRRKIVRVMLTDRDETPSPTPNSHSSVIIPTKIPVGFLGI